MATSDDFLTFVQERFAPAVQADYRKMFGGVGIYEQGVMFALITGEDELFFRVDDETRPGFEALGSRQFMTMPYFAAPADALEDDARLSALIGQAVAAAKRAAAQKEAKGGPKRRRGRSGGR